MARSEEPRGIPARRPGDGVPGPPEVPGLGIGGAGATPDGPTVSATPEAPQEAWTDQQPAPGGPFHPPDPIAGIAELPSRFRPVGLRLVRLISLQEFRRLDRIG